MLLTFFALPSLLSLCGLGGVLSIRFSVASARASVSLSEYVSGLGLLMASSIIPAFDRHPAEAALIGMLMAGYGELEFMLAWLVRWIIDDEDKAFRFLYRSRGESQRIMVAEALIAAPLRGHRYQPDMDGVISDLRHCLAIRNQYAHANWADAPAGLTFASLEQVIDLPPPISPSGLTMHTATVKGLRLQHRFFCAVGEMIGFLNFEFQVEGGGIASNPFPRPARGKRPNL